MFLGSKKAQLAMWPNRVTAIRHCGGEAIVAAFFAFLTRRGTKTSNLRQKQNTQAQTQRNEDTTHQFRDRLINI